MMKKMRNISAIALIAILVYLITVGTTITSYAAEETISIPVILNYEGDAWIDQNGDSVGMELAKEFLSSNPKYAWEILYLNNNPCYMVGIQNAARSEVIDGLRKEYNSKKRETYYNSDCNKSTCVDALEKFIAAPPADDAFNKLLVHLQNNGARGDVENLQEFCQKGVVASSSAEAYADYLFFGILVENYESGCLDGACGVTVMGTTSPQIPVILLADQKTWLDQDGNIMDGERAEFFLTTNYDYTRRIAVLNSNSHCLPWRSEAEDDLIALLWKRFRLSISEENRYATEYAWAAHDILNNPPSVDILKDYQGNIESNIAVDDITKLIGYIDGTVDQPREGYLLNYIFWSAVAKATENGNIEIKAETTETIMGTTTTLSNSAADKEGITESNYVPNCIDKDEPDWNNMTHTEIIEYFDSLEDPETAFDMQHPGLYFDQYGKAHDATGSVDTYYYATYGGIVYEIIDHNLDLETMELGPVEYSPNLRYVGQTNRRIQ